MGGNALATPAERLTTAQLTALYTLTTPRLSPLFTPIATPRAFTTKPDHGDLDVLAGWSGVGWEPGKGASQGAAMGADEATAWLATEGDAEQVTLKSAAAALDRWCAAVAGVVGGVWWRRSGAEISIGVPVSVLDGATSSPPTTTAGPPRSPKTKPKPKSNPSSHMPPLPPFYQLDLILLPPPSVPFATFVTSYGSMLLLLSHFLRQATRAPAVTLQPHRLVLRTRPFPSLSAVDVPLTADAGALCAWVGLDYGRWQAGAWLGNEDVFSWFEGAGKAGAVGGEESRRRGVAGLHALAAKGKGRVRSKSHKHRIAVMDEFAAWLQARGWGEGEGEDDRSSVADADDTPTAPATSTNPGAVPGQPHPQEYELDADNPAPRTAAETAVLAYFHKQAAYAAGVEALRPATRQKAEAFRARAGRTREERVAAYEERRRGELGKNDEVGREGHEEGGLVEKIGALTT